MCGLGDIAKYALLPGHVQRSRMIADRFHDSRKIAEYREFVTYTGVYSGIPVTVTSTGIGGPSASIAVEELANLGAKTFIRVGTTGSLQIDVDVGDIIIASAAVRSDGASVSYIPSEYPAVADLTVISALQEAAEKVGARFHTGIVWSYDAFYAETEEKIRTWSRARVLAIDSETSPIFVVSSLRGLRAGSIMVVDGNLVAGTKKGEFEADEAKGEADPKVESAIKKEIEVALEAIRILEDRNE
jgi:uridine phosphorylase